MMTNIYSIVLSKPAMPVLMGLCIGVALSLIVAPFLESHCGTLSPEYSAGLPIRPLIVKSHQAVDVADVPPLVVNKDAIPENSRQQQPQQRLIRPRFISTELGIHEKLFVAILTSAETFETRGFAVNRTLNHFLEKVSFFLSSRSGMPTTTIPAVVFSDNKQHMTPFHTFRYIGDHYINAYDWFYVAPDSTYVNGEQLVNFVSHISVAANLLIGRPVESGNGETLLAAGCNLGAGILMSQV